VRFRLDWKRVCHVHNYKPVIRVSKESYEPVSEVEEREMEKGLKLGAATAHISKGGLHNLRHKRDRPTKPVGTNPAALSSKLLKPIGLTKGAS
jgi:hypothetical protein